MMQNPLLRQLKKFVMSQSAIKKVAATNRQLMNIIDSVDLFRELCRPSKIRLRGLLQVHQIECGNAVPISDSIQTDFLYVCRGMLQVVFLHRARYGAAAEKVLYLRKGDYLDSAWKDKEYRDYVIKEVIAVAEEEHSQAGRANTMKD